MQIDHQVPIKPNHKTPTKLADGACVWALRYRITIPMVSIFTFAMRAPTSNYMHTMGRQGPYDSAALASSFPCHQTWVRSLYSQQSGYVTMKIMQFQKFRAKFSHGTVWITMLFFFSNFHFWLIYNSFPFIHARCIYVSTYFFQLDNEEESRGATQFSSILFDLFLRQNFVADHSLGIIMVSMVVITTKHKGYSIGKVALVFFLFLFFTRQKFYFNII